MRGVDLLALGFETLQAHRVRYRLSGLAIAVGVAAVVLMSSIGEGIRRFVTAQVTSFGTTIVGVHPGHVETGGMPGAAGGSRRRLTIDDARALGRLPGVVAAVPLGYGTAPVEFGDRSRRVMVIGATAEAEKVWSLSMAGGQFLPAVDWARGTPVAVLGPRLKRELFGSASALGAPVRIGTARYRVIGVLEAKGQLLTFDMDDTAYIPVANALRLFNQPELAEINLLAASIEETPALADRARRLMIERHDGDEDVTVISQKDAMQMVDRILGILTGTVTAIAGISLLVGAIGIFTILWIVVHERVQEIGLVKALGGTRRQIVAWYLGEAVMVACGGGLAGLLGGAALAALLGRLVPRLEFYTPPWIVGAALAMAFGVGILAGVAPAARAASLDPIEALRSE